MDCAARHVDGFNLLRRRLLDRLKITVADREIFPDRPLEPTERQNHRFEMRLVFAIDIERKPPFLHPQRNVIRPFVAVLMLALWREIIAFENVENGNTPLLLDIGIAPDDRALIQFDVRDARVGHAAAHIRRACEWKQRKTCNRPPNFSQTACLRDAKGIQPPCRPCAGATRGLARPRFHSSERRIFRSSARRSASRPVSRNSFHREHRNRCRPQRSWFQKC